MTMQGGKSHDIGCSEMTLDKKRLGIFLHSEGIPCDVLFTTAGNYVRCSRRTLQRHKKNQRSFVTHHRSLMDVHVGEFTFTPRVLIAHDIVRVAIAPKI